MSTEAIKTKCEKCSSCGGNMAFDVKNKTFFCEKCSSSVIVPLKKPKFVKYSETSNFGKVNDVSGEISNKCPNCGGNINFSAFEFASQCPYCSTGVVAEDKKFEELMPFAIIPFLIDKQNAKNLYNQQLKKKHFISSSIKKNSFLSDMKKIFVPVFLFNADVSASYSGNVVEQEDVNGPERERFVSGSRDARYTNVISSASNLYQTHSLDSLGRYDFDQMNVYDHRIVVGSNAFYYDKKLKECLNEAKSIMESNIQSEIESGFSVNDNVKGLLVSCDFDNIEYLYCLLPVYELDVKHKEKTYKVLMNGQTGKLGSGFPISATKIVMLVLSILLALAVPILCLVLLL